MRFSCSVRFSLLVTIIAGIGFLTGCSNSPVVPMVGAVTLDGKPVNGGVLTLTPLDLKAAPSTGSAIVNGRYQVPAAKGVHRGLTYRVEVSAVDRSKAASEREVVLDSIPAAYNRESKLTVSVPNEASSVEQDFALNSSVQAVK